MFLCYYKAFVLWKVKFAQDPLMHSEHKKTTFDKKQTKRTEHVSWKDLYLELSIIINV